MLFKCLACLIHLIFNLLKSPCAGSGVSTDIWTSYAARIMVISVLPFVIVQLPQILNSTSGRHLAVLIALIVSLCLLVAYCLYQVIFFYSALVFTVIYFFFSSSASTIFIYLWMIHNIFFVGCDPTVSTFSDILDECDLFYTWPLFLRLIEN